MRKIFVMPNNNLSQKRVPESEYFIVPGIFLAAPADEATAALADRRPHNRPQRLLQF